MGGTTQEGTRKTVQKTTQEDVGTARGRRERLREQTDRKIMKATLGIVISDGIGAVTIEEVARRSGVAKTTIYRRYRNADDLLQRIQPEVAGLPNFNDLKPSRSGLATMLRRIQDCFDSELGLKAVGVVLSSDNATLKAIAAQVLAPAEERFVGFMERGIADGVFQNRLVVEPIGAVMTILVAQLVIPALPYLLSFAAGAMLYVVVEELIPEMSQGQHSNIGTLFFALGFSLMMILDVALG